MERSPGQTALCLLCATTSSFTPYSRNAACLFYMHLHVASSLALPGDQQQLPS